MTWMSD
jgi:hypothetical protein